MAHPAGQSVNAQTVRFVLIAFLAWRGALFAADFVGLNLFPELPNPHKDYSAFPDPHYLWNSFARWDSGWYMRVAERGYYLEGPQSDVAFFPGFPLAARLLGRIVGNHWTAGILVSNGSLFAALLFLHGIARRHLDEAGAERAVLAALCFPTTFFYSCYYSEGLFFLAVCGAFYFYEKDRLLLAALFGALAAFTRASGIFLLPALALGVVHRSRGRALRPPRLALLRVLWLLPIAGGLGAFMWMLAVEPRVDDPMAWLEAQTGWGRATGHQLATLWQEAIRWPADWSHPTPENAEAMLRILDWAGALVIGAAALHTARRIDPAHALFALATLLATLASGRVLSLHRLALGVPAVFLMIARLTGSPSTERTWFCASASMAALLTIAFATWRFAG